MKQLFLVLSLCVVFFEPVFSATQKKKPPIKKIAPERFELRKDSHLLTFPYQSSHSLHESNSLLTRLVISQHGARREAVSYFASMLSATKKAEAEKETLIIAPQFLELLDLQKHQPAESRILYFSGSWREGGESLSTKEFPRPATISNFEILDRLLIHCAEAFPSIREIVFMGHSAGGQLVNRYSLASHAHDDLMKKGIKVRYIAYNPSSYVYLTLERFDPETGEYGIPKIDAGYNDYKYGLEEPNAYFRELPLKGLLERFTDRHVIYMIGEEDNDAAHSSLDLSPKVAVQGKTRLDRSLKYFRHIGQACGPKIYRNQKICILPNVGHQSKKGFESPGGQYWIFGKGVRIDGPLAKWSVSNLD